MEQLLLRFSSRDDRRDRPEEDLKDDRPGPTFITYNILFVCFLILLIFGMVNLLLAK